MSRYAWIVDVLLFGVAPLAVWLVWRHRRKPPPALPAPWTEQTPGYRPDGVAPWRPKEPR